MILMNLVKNRCVDTAGEGEGDENRASSIDIYTPSCVKQWKVAVESKEPAWCSLMNLRAGMWGGKRGSEEGDTYIIVTDSHCHMPETNRTL